MKIQWIDIIHYYFNFLLHSNALLILFYKWQWCVFCSIHPCDKMHETAPRLLMGIWIVGLVFYNITFEVLSAFKRIGNIIFYDIPTFRWLPSLIIGLLYLRCWNFFLSFGKWNIILFFIWHGWQDLHSKLKASRLFLLIFYFHPYYYTHCFREKNVLAGNKQKCIKNDESHTRRNWH